LRFGCLEWLWKLQFLPAIVQSLLLKRVFDRLRFRWLQYRGSLRWPETGLGFECRYA
jgi:hypothetical protein